MKPSFNMKITNNIRNIVWLIISRRLPVYLSFIIHVSIDRNKRLLSTVISINWRCFVFRKKNHVFIENNIKILLCFFHNHIDFSKGQIYIVGDY